MGEFFCSHRMMGLSILTLISAYGLGSRAWAGERNLSLHVTQPQMPENQIPVVSSSLQRGLNIVAPQRMLEQLTKAISANGLKIVTKSTGKTAILGAQKTIFGFTIAGVPLCEYQVQEVSWQQDDKLLLGSMPPNSLDNMDPMSLQYAAWPDQKLTLDLVSDALRQQGYQTANLVVESQEKCLVVRDDYLNPVWNLVVRTGAYSFRAKASEQDIYDLQAGFFDVTGSSTIYPNNSNDQNTETFELAEMKTTGKLESSHFYITIGDGSKEALATSTNSVFNFQPGTSAFSQTSIFTNATRTYEWFVAHGYTHFGNYSIELVAHAFSESNDDPNNALYSPSITNPTIYIGDGDGEILQNLSTDSDVVSHEFGHHVIFNSVKSTMGESLVLHEGIADFFTFAKTGNTCLGESICPANSPIHCAVEAECLRSASNSYQYGGADLPNEAHNKSQFISGMLWDLHEKDGLEISTLVTLVLSTIDLLASDSGYHDLVLGLLLADKSLNSSSHCQLIYSRAEARGLGSVIGDFGCGSELPSIVEGSTTSATVTNATSKSSGGNHICGSITGSSHTLQNVIPGLLFLLPFGLIWLFGFWRSKSAS